MRVFGTSIIAAAVVGLPVLALSSPYFTASNYKSLFSVIGTEWGGPVQRGVSYGTHPRQKLDIYRPEPGPETGEQGPVVLFFYGGGWRGGDRTTYGFVGGTLAARGITTVIADYRLYPEVRFPAFVEDGALAYDWVARNLARDRPIFLAGHSSGAHLAALLALDGRYLQDRADPLPPPAGLIGLAGPYAFDPTTWETTKDIFAGAQADQTRPIAFARAGMPPALLMHGLADETVVLWNTRTLAEALEKSGVPVRKREFDGVGHVGIVTALARPLRWRAPVLDEIVDFIRSAGN